jgi:hypothetical protein
LKGVFSLALAFSVFAACIGNASERRRPYQETPANLAGIILITHWNTENFERCYADILSGGDTHGKACVAAGFELFALARRFNVDPIKEDDANSLRLTIYDIVSGLKDDDER